MNKIKTLTKKKQKQRAELNAILSYDEAQLVAMQKQDWKNLDDSQTNILENFIATAITTMRLCPIIYRNAAFNKIRVLTEAARKEGESRTRVDIATEDSERPIPLVIDYGTDEKGNVYYSAEKTPVTDNYPEEGPNKTWAKDTLQKAVNQGKLEEGNGILREHNVQS